MKSGFYIHIPYCHSRCSYCDFLSDDEFDSGDLEKYRARILNDMNEIFSILPGHEIDTLFIGGGTPSVYSPEKLSEFVKKLTSLSGSNLSETTVEINPNVVDIAYMNKLHETGVFNRISFGLQSPFSKDNEYLGRKHLPESLDIISFAASLFDNVSIDLICGFPGFEPYKVISELERHGILQNIEHVSVYMLKYPQRLLDLHNLTEEDDDLQSSQYIEISEILEKKGFEKYEISNFSKKGFECRHNLHYWNYDDYLGAGAGACIKFNDRFVTFPETRFFLAGKLEDMLEQFEPAMEFPDRFIMGMRLINGMSYDILKKIHIDLPKAVDLIYNDYRTFFIKENDIIRFSGKGFLFSNTMLSMIIDKVREMG